MSSIVFYPSEVAALLDRHRFKTKEEALVRVLSSIPKFRPAIAQFKKETGAKTEREIVQQAPESIKTAIASAVSTATASSSQAEIHSTIEQFQKTATTTLLKDALDGKAVSSDFSAAAQRIRAGTSTPEKEAVALESAPVVTTLAREIQKQRGTRLESVAEDKHVKPVTNRNTPVRYECEEYGLTGYIDGMEGDKVLETKNRKRVWKEIPDYDLIQLRCYMKMRGEVDGVLLETFPGHPPRTTEVPWDDAEWDSIHDGLCSVAREIATLSSSELGRILRAGLLTKTDH